MKNKWHEDAVIVTVAVVKPKCLDLDYRKHCGQVLGEMKLPPATTQLCEHAYLTDPAELWSQPNQKLIEKLGPKYDKDSRCYQGIEDKPPPMHPFFGPQ